MSFDVFLIPSSASPMGPAAQAAIGRGLAVSGARWGKDGEDDIVLKSGEGVEFYGPDDTDAGGMFALRGLSAEVVEMIFHVADATSCFIIFPGDSPLALRTPANTGAFAEDDDVPIAPVASPAELGDRLGAPFDGWSDYAAAVTSGPSGDDTDDDDPEIDPTLLDRFFKPSKQD